MINSMQKFTESPSENKSASKFGTKMRNLCSRLTKSEDGVGAVEFALIVPVLLILYVGALELSVAMSIDKKVAKATSISADLITQGVSTDKTTLQEMLGVAKSVVAPFDSSSMNMQVVGIQVDASGNPTIAWSWDETNSSPLTDGDPITIPTAFEIPNTFLLQTTVDMDHDLLMLVPGGGGGISGFLERTVNLGKVYYLHQREAETITCSDC
jgi:Flp pilus assembly protein TadG